LLPINLSSTNRTAKSAKNRAVLPAGLASPLPAPWLTPSLFHTSLNTEHCDLPLRGI
jgi:hypothetical protein